MRTMTKMIKTTRTTWIGSSSSKNNNNINMLTKTQTYEILGGSGQKSTFSNSKIQKAYTNTTQYHWKSVLNEGAMPLLLSFH